MRFLLAPISWIYSLIVRLRNLLYDEGILRSHEVEIPTICVGNLALGGTGKTPHVEYIASVLSRQFKVAILSRGYKRKSRGFVLADSNSTAALLGDEVMQMHLHFPDIPIAVCNHRVKGIQQLMSQIPDLQVVILDDGFQHRRLKCGFNILLTPYDKLYTNDHVIPLGRLREPAEGATRANGVIVTKCTEQMTPIERRVIVSSLHVHPFQKVWFSKYNYGEIYAVFENAMPLPDKSKLRPLILTGIAHPEYLIETIDKTGLDYSHLRFDDHHNFTKSDMEKIRRACKVHRANCIITTEKDAVRLYENKFLTDDIKSMLYALPIQVEILQDAEVLIKQIISYVTENNRNR